MNTCQLMTRNHKAQLWCIMVPGAGVEPAMNLILDQARLPISPSRQITSHRRLSHCLGATPKPGGVIMRCSERALRVQHDQTLHHVSMEANAVSSGRLGF